MHRITLRITFLVGVCLAFGGCGRSATPIARASRQSSHSHIPEKSSRLSDSERAARSFGDMLSKYIHSRYQPPANLDQAIKKWQTVVVGQVADLVVGRREMLGDGSDPEFYVQYYDIVIRPEQVIKGTSSTSADVHIEFIWPKNLSVDELSAALPRKARAIVLGASREGIATPHTLLHVPPYGLIVETSNGATALPFERDEPFQKAVPGVGQQSFAELRAAVASTRQL
jgi:hypothetical protein